MWTRPAPSPYPARAFEAGLPEAAWQDPGVFFSPRSIPVARAAIARCIARIEGVQACEAMYVAGATLPSCGSGLVVARAGKALDARGASSCIAQLDAKGSVPGVTGEAGSCMAHPGSPAHTAAISNGVFMFTSIDTSF
jgi:hypothetical protein